MDPKLFLFLVFSLLTVLENCSAANEIDKSSIIQKNSHRRSSRHSKVHRRKTLDKKYRLPDHDADRLRIRNDMIPQSDMTENILKTFIESTTQDEITEMTRQMIKKSKLKNRKRDNKDYTHDHLDSTTVENYTADVTNNAEELSTQPPQEGSWKTKRKMKKKQNKKYKPVIEYIKLKDKRNTDYTLKSDVPDNAEGILDEFVEITKKTTTKPKKLKSKKGLKSRKHNKVGDKSKRKHGKARRLQDSHNKKKNGKAKLHKKQHNATSVASTKSIKGYFVNIHSEDVEHSTEYMPKANHERTEIIYLTPNPRNRKYKPEFRYIPIDSEPMNYGSLHYNHNTDINQSNESETSKSTSKESEEIDSNQKKAANWADLYKVTKSEEDYDEDEDEGNTSETSEEESNDVDESDHDHYHLKVRRTAEEKWKDLEAGHIIHPNKRNVYKSLQNSNVINNKIRKTKILRNKNFQMNMKSRLDTLQDKMGPVIQYGNQDYDNVIPQEKISIQKSTSQHNVSPVTYEEEWKRKYVPTLQYRNKYQRVLDKLFRGRFTRDVMTPGFISDNVTEKLEPLLENSKNYDINPEQTFMKRSTLHESIKIVKINHGKEITIKHQKFSTTNEPEDTTTMEDDDETYTDSYKEIEKTPSYEVHENVIDIPDNRHIPGPIVPHYVIASDQKFIASPNMRNKIGTFNPSNLQTHNDYNDHPIVNIVQGVKDYFTGIGKGLYNTVKEFFKDRRRRRRSINSK